MESGNTILHVLTNWIIEWSFEHKPEFLQTLYKN